MRNGMRLAQCLSLGLYKRALASNTVSLKDKSTGACNTPIKV